MQKRHRRALGLLLPGGMLGATQRKALALVATVGVVGSVAGWGAYSAFTATTANAGNSITAGTVNISQHAGATTLYSSSAQGPGSTITKCVRVTYSGSLNASVKLYVSSGITNGDEFNLTVERGSGLSSPGASMSCAGFSASSTAYNGELGSLGTNWGSGIDGKASSGTWNQNDSVDYRFTVEVEDDSTPNAHTSPVSSGSHTFTWEARNN